MEKKFTAILKRYQELNEQLSDPDILKNKEKYRDCAKAQAEIAPLANKIKEWQQLNGNITDAEEMLAAESDAEMRRFLTEEAEKLRAARESLEAEIKILLLPKDPNDNKNIIMEIRAGAGGQEAGIFAGDLYRLYTKYAESRGWRTEVMSSSPSDMGGFKEIIFEINGKGAYSRLKFESGVHRVQRVPVTESGGRIHTSTATVAVLPEADEIEIKIDPGDIKVDIFRSSGPGGQSVNTTDSAVRLTHLPTGLVVSCQDEKSQLQNKEKATRILRARLFDKFQAEQQDAVASQRRLQIGTGDRSERIRTYNFPQGRVTDHRIGLTLYNLDEVMEGKIDAIIDALATEDKAEKLKKVI